MEEQKFFRVLYGTVLDEEKGESKNSAGSQKGEGRTRYLSIIGISFSILFFVITAVGALTTAIVPLCAA